MGQVVVSPWWFSMKDWEKAQNLPNKAMRTLAQNDNSVFHKVFAGDVMPDAAAKELLVEMKGQGMEVGNLKAEELGVQLTNLLKTARVNGDGQFLVPFACFHPSPVSFGHRLPLSNPSAYLTTKLFPLCRGFDKTVMLAVRDAMQCLRFDGYQTALLTRNWKTIDIGSNLGKVGRENPLKSEISRHFNVIVETEELGVSHTDVKVLERLCDGLKMEPQDIALVDRSEDILKAARDFGLVTVQVPFFSSSRSRLGFFFQLWTGAVSLRGFPCFPDGFLEREQADGPGTAVRNLETLLDVPLANFAWTRDQYAKVLWGGNYAPVMKQGAGVGV